MFLISSLIFYFSLSLIRDIRSPVTSENNVVSKVLVFIKLLYFFLYHYIPQCYTSNYHTSMLVISNECGLSALSSWIDRFWYILKLLCSECETLNRESRKVLEGNCVENSTRNTDPRLQGYLKGLIFLPLTKLELYISLETVYEEVFGWKLLLFACVLQIYKEI